VRQATQATLKIRGRVENRSLGELNQPMLSVARTAITLHPSIDASNFIDPHGSDPGRSCGALHFNIGWSIFRAGANPVGYSWIL
jgi:hypothetical protein